MSLEQHDNLTDDRFLSECINLKHGLHLPICARLFMCVQLLHNGASTLVKHSELESTKQKYALHHSVFNFKIML